MKQTTKKRIGTTLKVGFAVTALAVSLTSCSSCQREWKSFTSDISGGLDRTVTVYDYNGNVIKTYTGKFDISENENEIFFDDQNGKRVIIHGGIVICEEN